MQVSDRFIQRVRDVWGDPEKVAQAGINETFEHEDCFGLDHDDQVDNAMRIGVLAGLTANQTPQTFIDGFEKLVE